MARREVQMCGTVLYTSRWPLDADRVAAYVCALLNGAGGTLVFGKTSDGTVVGAGGSAEAFSGLESDVRSRISPPPFLMMSRAYVDGKLVVSLNVPRGCEPPYLQGGKAYLLQAGKLVYADSEQLRSLVMRSATNPVRWEERFSLADVEHDVDDLELERGLMDAKSRMHVDEGLYGELEQSLRFFEVYRDDRLLNAGDLLFAKNPCVRIPQARIRAYAYATDKTGDAFLDSALIEAPICRAINEALLFIARNTNHPQLFSGVLFARRTIPSYPEEAMREALVNALVHRDYSSSEGGVAIHVYPTRLEIWNSGDLAEGVSADRLGKDQISIIRNATIAHVLYVRGVMEQAGRGSLKMAESCRKSGLPPPVWSAKKGLGVQVVFQRVVPMGRIDPFGRAKRDPFGHGAVGEAKTQIIEALRQSQGLNRAELCTLTKASESTVKRALQALVKEGSVERVKGKRYGSYRVLEQRHADMKEIDFDYKCIIASCYEAEHSMTGRSAAGYCPESKRRLMQKLTDEGLIRYEEDRSVKSLHHYVFLGFTDKGRERFVANDQIKPIYQLA